MKKILITGSPGMLATAMLEQLNGNEVQALTVDELDITCGQQVHKTLHEMRPDYIINCAAYTAVDLAEEEVAIAYKINATAVQLLAQVAKEIDATLIHFSTDYVFNGKATKPYSPGHATEPINVYGASKLAGEQAIKTLLPKYYIFRISWLYAAHGKNFFKWMMDSTAHELNIVDTQIGSPTSAHDVAEFIDHLIENDPEHYGLYHFVNKGVMSWYAFAKAIKEKAGLEKKVTPVDEFPTAAERPAYSVMDCQKTQDCFNYQIRSVDDALSDVINRNAEI